MEPANSIATAGTPPFRAMEHRWGQRKPCRATVRISAGAGLDGAGRLRDVSSSGAFVESTLALPVGRRITLGVSGDGSGGGFALDAIVVRGDPEGVGIEWCDTAAGSICAVLGCTRRCSVKDGPVV